jgi:phosphocarrier protein HPr
MSEVNRTVTIRNRLGLHARPAGEFVKIASKFESTITVTKDELEVNGKSIMGVMTLAAECGSKVTVHAEGMDAEAAVEAVAEVLDREFGDI